MRDRWGAGVTRIATEYDSASAALPVSLPAFDPISGVRLPTMVDVVAAREVIAAYLQPTPLLSTPALDELLECQVFLKCENLQPIGAFKVRGGLFLMSQLTPAERARGVVTASTGNHGQSIAYAAREFGTAATVWMPEVANPLKVASMLRLGAEVRFAGRDFDECREEAERDAARQGAQYIVPANDWRLIAGVATYTVEMLDAVPRSRYPDRPRGRWLGACRRLSRREGALEPLAGHWRASDGRAGGTRYVAHP